VSKGVYVDKVRGSVEEDVYREIWDRSLRLGRREKASTITNVADVTPL
jgi:hypothetical protein